MSREGATTAFQHTIDPQAAGFIAAHRVARLATADGNGDPHVIPICYAFDGRHIYSALDWKPKRVPALQLNRVKNILANPSVALVIDEYSEDWEALAYVLVKGVAAIVDDALERRKALRMLREKYPQYARSLEEGCTLLKVTPTRVTGWGRL